MHKSVFIGAGLGVLVLALITGHFWMAEKPKPMNVSAVHSTASSAHTTPSANHVTVAPATGSAMASLHSSQETQERRKRLAALRVELNALRAQGAQASPEKMRALIDEMQVVAPSSFDPRYFQALHSMLDANAQVQTLNTELQTLAKSTSAKDEARRQEIIAQIRTLGERVNTEARHLQSYAPASSTPGVKLP